MARTFSLLLALALAPVARALGVVELCPCAAKEVETCDIAGRCDPFLLRNGQCDDLEPDTVNVPCMDEAVPVP